MKILELQITITKGHNSRFQTAKEIASELEGKPTEIMQSEEPREKALKKIKNLQSNKRHQHTYKRGSRIKGERERDRKKYSEKYQLKTCCI